MFCQYFQLSHYHWRTSVDGLYDSTWERTGYRRSTGYHSLRLWKTTCSISPSPTLNGPTGSSVAWDRSSQHIGHPLRTFQNVHPSLVINHLSSLPLRSLINDIPSSPTSVILSDSCSLCKLYRILHCCRFVLKLHMNENVLFVDW